MTELFLSGLLLGASNGVAPGPLSNLIISKTITHGKKEGFLLALAPFASDVFIISIAYFLVKGAEYLVWINTLIPFIGAGFISYLAVLGLRASSVHSTDLLDYKFKDAVLVNLFNPYPYLFWVFVGVPLIVNSSYPVIFLLGFYSCFMAIKLLIIWLVDLGLKNRTMKIKQRVNQVLSISLFYFTYKLIMMGARNL